MKLHENYAPTEFDANNSVGELKALTDPWLTEGEYYGSWYHYPPFEDKNLASLEYDFIYVSHIHPDHLSEKTFKVLLTKNQF